jgi:ABC-type antimicrobial peptide transport system permease subunit
VKIPLSYSYRNLFTRRLTTALTAAGMAMVVFVFTATLMLSSGLEKTLVETGSFDNVIIIRKGSGTEVQSGVERLQASYIETQPEIALGQNGDRLCAKELTVLITMPKRGSNKPSNVVIRGISETSLSLRPQVKLVQGRMPQIGTSEIIAGKSIAERFQGGSVGDTLRFAQRTWLVVGVFEAGATSFNSEIWGDVNQLMQAFRREAYSSMLLKLRNSSEFDAFKKRIETDPRLTVEAKRETRYYKDQSEMMAKFLRILGVSLSIVFSLGAMIGAMITMYASVAHRTSEIGALRAIGFQKSSILLAFLFEALFLGSLGGGLGVFLASFLQLLTVSTMNFQTFSELAFSFSLTFKIALQAMIFSLIMGFVGGALPAFKASRMNIVDSLRGD